MRTRENKTLRNERSVERFLARRIEGSIRIQSVRTFEEAGLLTMDRGLVITTPDGRQFELRIVQSR